MRMGTFTRKLIVWLLAASPVCGATTFYVDAEHGNDAGKGASPETAWASLAKVKAQKFAPGDSLLFHAGQVWTGTLEAHGSGSAAAPILVSSYGDGAKPRIDGVGAAQAVLLSEVSYWTLRGLAVTNHGKTVGIRNGIMVHVAFAGVSYGIHLVEVDVSDVNGEVGSKSSGGIGVMAWGKNGKTAHFEDLVIERCTVKHVDGQGIWFHVKKSDEEDDDGTEHKQLNTNVRITRTTIEDTGRNAIFLRATEGASIDHNVVRFASARTHGNAVVVAGTQNVVIRENEVSHTGEHQGGGENGAFDADDGAQNTLIEYNWSHDNAGGMANVVNDPRIHGLNSDNVIRYNISENDGARAFSVGGDVKNTLFYNNTIFIGKGQSPHVLSAGRFVKHVPGDPDGIGFFNNVVYNLGSANFDISATRVGFDSNCYFGGKVNGGAPDKHVEVAHVPSGVSQQTMHSFTDAAQYAVPANSGCAKPGLKMPDAGTRDFLGTPIAPDAPMGRGAIVAP